MLLNRSYYFRDLNIFFCDEFFRNEILKEKLFDDSNLMSFINVYVCDLFLF